jgi:hypothetical protein
MSPLTPTARFDRTVQITLGEALSSTQSQPYAKDPTVLALRSPRLHGQRCKVPGDGGRHGRCCPHCEPGPQAQNRMLQHHMEDEAKVLRAYLPGYRTPTYPAHGTSGSAVEHALRQAIVMTLGPHSINR